MWHRGNTIWGESIWGEYGTIGQSMAIKGKYDQIRVINATLGQK